MVDFDEYIGLPDRNKEQGVAIAFIKGCLFDATQENYALSEFYPAIPTTEWLDGVGDGRRLGIIQALALSLAAITGESPTQLIEDAYAQAQIQFMFPFELFINEEDNNE